MREDTCVAVMTLLERLKEIASDRRVDQISDEIRALCRSEAVPTLGSTENAAWPLS